MEIIGRQDAVKQNNNLTVKFGFKAMGSPCEILIKTENKKIISVLKGIALNGKNEVERLEKKYSRYRKESLLCEINSGKKIKLDSETKGIFHIADVCFNLSEGLFDVTAGVLNNVWSFYGDKIDSVNHQLIQKNLKHVGWKKLILNDDVFQLPQGMSLDFGGIVKEYAVDRVFEYCKELLNNLDMLHQVSFLINLGGDLRTFSCPEFSGWSVGINSSKSNGSFADKVKTGSVMLNNKALTTSGSTERYILFNGKRYGHILNPFTGYPIENQPDSVSVMAETALQAGMLSTIAMTKGDNAAEFLNKSGEWFRLK